MASNNHSVPLIYLFEDNEPDALLVRMALDRQLALFELQTASEGEAKKLRITINSFLAKIKLLLIFFAPPAVSELLASMKFAQEGDEVTATATIEKGSKVAELLMTLPKR